MREGWLQHQSSSDTTVYWVTIPTTAGPDGVWATMGLVVGGTFLHHIFPSFCRSLRGQVLQVLGRIIVPFAIYFFLVRSTLGL